MRRSFSVLFFSFLVFSTFAQSNKKIAERSVQRDAIITHLGYLASDELLGRDTPSPGLDSAAAYIARHFFKWDLQKAPGLDSYFQKVNLKTTEPSLVGYFSIGDSIYNLENDMLQLSKGEVKLSAPLVYLEYGSDEDFAKADVKGKIVIARSGTRSAQTVRQIFISGREKALRAKEGGAVAIVELYNSPQTRWKIIQYYLRNRQMSLDFPDEGEDVDDEDESTAGIHRFWLEDMGNHRNGFLMNLSDVATLEVQGGSEQKFTSQNVIGFVPGTDPTLRNEVVVYSAHYDHVGTGKADATGDTIYNGTRDNAIGTMTVLEAARSIAANPLKRSALFILFTGEEKGLLGSEWYVSYPVIPHNQVVFCFNSDNAGYNDVTKATVVGLSRTSAGAIITKACKEFGITAIDDPVPDQNLYDRSDQVNFAREGVPSIMFSMGLTAFDEEVTKYYHQAADNPDSVDYDYLLKFTRAYVLAAREIGNAPKRPYWTAGDKYFEAGERLYDSTP